MTPITIFISVSFDLLIRSIIAFNLTRCFDLLSQKLVKVKTNSKFKEGLQKFLSIPNQKDL